MKDYINSYQKAIASHFTNFPIGLIILSSTTRDNGTYIVSYINTFASDIMPLAPGKQINTYRTILASIHQRELNQLSKITLYDTLFNSNNTDSNETYFSSEGYLINIKIKFNDGFIYLSLDNLNEQRKATEEKIIKSISCKFLTTLAHEINNPLNSIISTIEQINSPCINRLKLLVFLVKTVIQKLMVYSKSIFDSALYKEKKSCSSLQNDIVDLQFIFMKLATKFAVLFEYKKILIDNDFSLLQNCFFKCDGYYLKQLIKNLWLYLYYLVPRDSKISIVLTIQNNDVIKMTFQYEGTQPHQLYRQDRESRKDLLSNSPMNLDASVNTIETLQEILIKVSEFLDVELRLIEEEGTYVQLEFQNVIINSMTLDEGEDEDEDEDDEVDECINNWKNYQDIIPTFSTLSASNSSGNNNNNHTTTTPNANNTKCISDDVSLNGTLSKNISPMMTKNEQLNYSPSKKKNTKSFHDARYVEVCFNFGKSFAKYLEHLKDPLMDNLKNPNSPLLLTKSSKKTEDFKKLSKITFKEDDLSSNKKEIPKLSMNYLRKIATKTLKRKVSNESIQKVKMLSNEKKPINILIVDDEEYNLTSLQNLLKKEKLFSDTCMNGQESIQYLQKNPNVKLVFMDMFMPIMNGLEACKKIEEMASKNEINPNIIIIIVSAHPPESIQFSNFQLKVVKEFIQKPMKKNKLQKILKDFYK